MNLIDTLITAGVGIQAWALLEIIGIKVRIASLPCQSDNHRCTIEKKIAMRKYLTLFVFVGGDALLLLSGCTTPNPKPPVAGEPFQPIVADTAAISNVVHHVQAGLAATAPINPFSGMLELVLTGVAAVVTGVSLTVAKIKSAKATKADAVAATLAAGVVKAGPAAVAAVNEHASYTSDYAGVAGKINDATP